MSSLISTRLAGEFGKYTYYRHRKGGKKRFRVEHLEVLDMPGHLIRRLNQISTALFADRMAAMDIRLTPVQFAALAALDHTPGLDQATLAATVFCDRATIGGVVDRLTARGLVTREVSVSDRRARVLALSDAGRNLLAQARPVVVALQDEITLPLGDDDRAELLRLLRRVTGTDPS